VLSVDASGVGLRKAQQWAAEQGVALQTELADQDQLAARAGRL
jgi:hypothetical protein